MKSDGEQDALLEHEYDGVREYDNPLPGWWVWIFIATIAWSALYWFNVPFFGPGKGRLAAYEKEMAAYRALRATEAKNDPLATATDASLAADEKDAALLALGKTTFTTTCAVCHRPDGGGNIGPNLTDEAWLHGGKPTEILHTVSTGVLEKGMPAWSQSLKPEQVHAVAVYVMTLRGTHPPNPKAPQGVEVEEH